MFLFMCHGVSLDMDMVIVCTRGAQLTELVLGGKLRALRARLLDLVLRLVVCLSMCACLGLSSSFAQDLLDLARQRLVGRLERLVLRATDVLAGGGKLEQATA